MSISGGTNIYASNNSNSNSDTGNSYETTSKTNDVNAAELETNVYNNDTNGDGMTDYEETETGQKSLVTDEKLNDTQAPTAPTDLYALQEGNGVF